MERACLNWHFASVFPHHVVRRCSLVTEKFAQGDVCRLVFAQCWRRILSPSVSLCFCHVPGTLLQTPTQTRSKKSPCNLPRYPKNVSPRPFLQFLFFSPRSRYRGVTKNVRRRAHQISGHIGEGAHARMVQRFGEFFGTRWSSCWSRSGGVLSTCRTMRPVHTHDQIAVRAPHGTSFIECVSKPKTTFM